MSASFQPLSSRTLSRISALGRKQKFKLRHYGLAEGISRSTWHRQRKAAHEREALAAMAAQRQAVLERAEAFMRQLQRDLAEAMRCTRSWRESFYTDGARGVGSLRGALTGNDARLTTPEATSKPRWRHTGRA